MPFLCLERSERNGHRNEKPRDCRNVGYMEHEYEKAQKALNLIACNLENRYLKAAASLWEGLEETLTVHRLKIPSLLRQTSPTQMQWNPPIRWLLPY